MKVRFNVRRYFQVLGVSLAVVIAAAAVCMGMDFTGRNNTELVDNTSTVAAADGKINVLLMTTDIDGLRTDAMMLASFDTETKVVNMMSIPRDTRMYIGNRYQKINAAHAYMKNGVIGGPTAACEAVTRITGIPINYYVDFTLDAVAHVINELGPIEFTIPDLYGDGVGMVYDDPVQSLHINLPPGTYKLDGSQAVHLMRYRHGNRDSSGNFKGYVNGDKDRVEMQQKFLKAVIDQKMNASLILKIPSIFKTVNSEMKTNFTVSDVVKYSKYLSGFQSENIHTHELPGRFDEVTIDGQRADVWEVDIEATRQLVQTVFGYPADTITIDNPNGSSESDNGSSKKVSSGSSGSGKSDKSESSSSSGSSSNSGGSSSGSGGTSGSSSSDKNGSSGTGSSGSGGSSNSGGSSSGSGGSSGSSLGTGTSGSSGSGGSLSGSDDDDDDEDYTDNIHSSNDDDE